MPGESLVGAFYVAAIRSNGPANRSALKIISTELGARLQSCTFREKDFDESLRNDSITFEQYRDYVSKHLRSRGVSDLVLFRDIEAGCWDLVKKHVHCFPSLPSVSSAEVFKLWRIFNRLANEHEYPPAISADVVDWFNDKVATSLGKQLYREDANGGNPKPSLTFQAFMKQLSTVVFSGETTEEVRRVIEEMSDWLVDEVLMSGRVSKRTRKQANWTSWTKRWAVLRAGTITYYDSSSAVSTSRRGEILINYQTKVQRLDSYNSMFHKLTNRFKVTNAPYIEMEVSPVDGAEAKESWIKALEEVIAASREGTSPVKKLLQRRFPDNRPQSKDIEEITVALEASALRTRKQTVIRLRAPAPVSPTSTTPVLPRLRKPKPSGENGASKRKSISNEAEDKMKVIFYKIDTNGNGKIDTREFSRFIDSLGLAVSPEECTLMFKSIDTDGSGCITFDEYARYFSDVIFNESDLGLSETRLRKAFLSADRDGTGTLNFREFAEYLWEKKRSIRISGLMSAFDQFEKTDSGEVDFNRFKQHYHQSNASQTLLPTITEDSVEDDSSLFEDKLKEFYTETESQDLAKFIRKRWEKFATFRRTGESGDVVMKGGHGMVRDVVPGDYSLLDLALFSDLPPLIPKHAVVKGFKWITSTVPGKSGQALFPKDFDGRIVSDIATNEHLRYYGCSLAEGQQLKVSLLYRHGIQDFTYENQYLLDFVTKANGGAGLERHEFSHLDCPLEEPSGNFILAKIVGEDELHVTAFHVPIRHTLYIPSNIIHCNDYLSGTWRTMLSDEADIDHVHLMRRLDDGEPQKFQFTFDR